MPLCIQNKDGLPVKRWRCPDNRMLDPPTWPMATLLGDTWMAAWWTYECLWKTPIVKLTGNQWGGEEIWRGRKGNYSAYWKLCHKTKTKKFKKKTGQTVLYILTTQTENNTSICQQHIDKYWSIKKKENRSSIKTHEILKQAATRMNWKNILLKEKKSYVTRYARVSQVSLHIIPE